MGKPGVQPLKRLMTVVLSNGATLRLPTAAMRTTPYRANQVGVKSVGMCRAALGKQALVHLQPSLPFHEFILHLSPSNVLDHVSPACAARCRVGSLGLVYDGDERLLAHVTCAAVP